MSSNESSRKENSESPARQDQPPKEQVTHNLDTGRDEPLTPPGPEEESTMDFAPGSGGGSAGDGGAA